MKISNRLLDIFSVYYRGQSKVVRQEEDWLILVPTEIFPHVMNQSYPVEAMTHSKIGIIPMLQTCEEFY